MPILENFNPFSWDQRVNAILKKESIPLFELEPCQLKMGVITLLTDMDKKIYVYVNGKRAHIGGINYWDLDYVRERIEYNDRWLRKKFKIVKVDAHLPFWLLKRLYLPYDWKPYKKSRKKRII